MSGGLRATWLTALAVLSFATVAWGLRGLVPLPEAGGLRTKFDAWSDTKDDYDILFLGSSQTLRGVQPSVIDERLSTPGQPIRSFNFGVPGMLSYRADALLERILEDAPDRTRWIVMEVPHWSEMALGRFSSSTLQSVHWHTPAQMRNVLGSIWLARSRVLLARIYLSWRHVRRFALYIGNIGMAGEIAAGRGWIEADTRGLLAIDVLALQGYEALEQRLTTRYTRRRETFDEKASTWRLRTALRRSHGPRPAWQIELEQYNYGALRRQVERIEETGRHVVYLSLPQSRDRVIGGVLLERGLIPELIDLNRPDLHPDLFTTGSHYDAQHMSYAGAARLSRILADELASRMRPVLEVEPR